MLRAVRVDDVELQLTVGALQTVIDEENLLAIGGPVAVEVRHGLLGQERFQVAYVGGVFAAGALMLDPLREDVTALAPHAFLAPPLLAPAEAAARMAGEQVQLALAG